MAALDVVSYCLSKKYTRQLSSGISDSSYNPATSTMTVNLNNGSSYDVVFDDGVSVKDRETLDNLKFDEDTSTLLVGNKEVLTKDDAVSDDDDLNFDNMFD